MTTHIIVKRDRLVLSRFAAEILITAIIVAGCGPSVPPPPQSPTAAPLTAELDAPPAVVAPQTGLHAVYTLKQRTGEGRLEIWSDDSFVRIEQQWSTHEGVGKQWGSDNVVMIFSAKEQKLAVINPTQNRYTRLDEAKMAQANAALTPHMPNIKMQPFPLPNVPNDESIEPGDGEAPSTVTVLKRTDAPKKEHPEGCMVYRQDLPFGLEEESCFIDPQSIKLEAGAMDALLFLGEFLRGMEKRIPEFGAVFAVAKREGINPGLLKSQFTFGVSLDIDQCVDPSGEMESWDRIIMLEKIEPCIIAPDSLNLPENSSEVSGIVPWPTPFLDIKSSKQPSQ